MDQIGTSHIAFADLLVCGVALALFLRLKFLPPNSALSHILAILSGCIVVAIIVALILANNLNRDAVFELAMIAIWLSIGLWNWNSARVEENVAEASEKS